MDRNIEKIVFDGDINSLSQYSLAQWMIERKIYVYNADIATDIMGKKLDTVGCQSINDFLAKYQNTLNEMNVPKFSIAYDAVNNDYVVNIDRINTLNDFESQVYLENIESLNSINTKDCDNIMDFKIKNQDVLNRIRPEIANQILEEVSKKMGQAVDVVGKESKKGMDVGNYNTSNNQMNENTLDELLLEQKKLLRTLAVWEKYKSGELDKSAKPSPSFAMRKDIIRQEMQSYEYLDKGIETAKEQLQNILNRPGRFSTEEEISALQKYYTAINNPSKINDLIISALDASRSLPVSSEMKPLLVEILERTSAKIVNENKSVETLEEEITKSKEQLQSILNRPGRFSTEEENYALQQYYAIISRPNETRRQLVSTLKMFESLPVSSEIRPLLIGILEKYNDKIIKELRQQYDNISNEEQAVSKYAEAMQNQTQETLESINSQIEKLQTSLENRQVLDSKIEAPLETKQEVNPDLETPLVGREEENITSQVPLENSQEINPTLSTQDELEPSLSNHSEPARMLPRQTLEADYYKRLENAAKEGPIFHDPDLDHSIDYDVTPEDKKLKIIKSVKRASVQLVNKIRDISFKQKISEVMDFFSEHKISMKKFSIKRKEKEVPAAFYDIENSDLLNSQEPNYWQDTMNNTSLPDESTSIEETENHYGRAM